MTCFLRSLRIPVAALLLVSLLSSCVFTRHAVRSKDTQQLGAPGAPTHAWQNNDSYTFRLEYAKDGKTQVRHTETTGSGGNTELRGFPPKGRPLEIRHLAGKPGQRTPPEINQKNALPFILVLQFPDGKTLSFLCRENGNFHRLHFPTYQTTTSPRVLLTPGALALDIIAAPILIPGLLFCAAFGMGWS